MIHATFAFEGQAFTFAHATDDIIYKSHAAGKFYEVDLLQRLRLLLQQIPAEEAVLDVGAHVGNHSVFLARVCGRVVMAFEPNPETYACLQQHAGGAEGHGWIETQPLAIGDGAGGQLHWYSGRVNTGNVGWTSGGGDVPSIRLDDVQKLYAEAGLRCGLLKLDIEGGEELALQHGQAFIAEFQPIIVVEDKQSRDRRAWPERLKLWDRLLPGYTYEGRYASTPTHVFLPSRVHG